MALETISSADFDRFRRLLYEHSGIHLADNKQPLLIGRLGRRLRELGLDSLRRLLSACHPARLRSRASAHDRPADHQRRAIFSANRSILSTCASTSHQTPGRHAISRLGAASSTGEEACYLAIGLAEALAKHRGKSSAPTSAIVLSREARLVFTRLNAPRKFQYHC